MSKQLFGTDGIRGQAGEYPLDQPTARRFGFALARLLQAQTANPKILLARDTRESGPWLRDAVATGIKAAGGEAVDLGILPTPGLAFLCIEHKATAGVMISASHNPYRDNGLKVFASNGMKLSDDLEAQLEALILSSDSEVEETTQPALSEQSDTLGRYLEHLKAAVQSDHKLNGLKIVLDAGNGAAAHCAPELYRAFGIEVIEMGCDPNGVNINEGCGSLHLEGLAERVRSEGAALGLAFDGDADRCLAVDAQGREVDGDYLLYLLARQLHRKGSLAKNAVVATIMSNLWLEQKLQTEGLTLLRAQVGDKYVLETMQSEGAILGGEQSGHIIYQPAASTGDGMLTGLLTLRCLVEEGLTLAEFRDTIEPCPQVLINVAVREKPDMRSHPEIGPTIKELEAQMSGNGRVVLRYSGTEPKARVMVEGRDAVMVAQAAESLAAKIRSVLSP